MDKEKEIKNLSLTLAIHYNTCIYRSYDKSYECISIHCSTFNELFSPNSLGSAVREGVRSRAPLDTNLSIML